MSESTTGHRGIRLLAAAVLVAVLAIVVPSSALAQGSTDDEPASDIAAIELATIGPIMGGDAQLVDSTATVSAERAIAGRLRIVDSPPDNPPTTWEFDLDLAAGTQVTIPFVATASWQGVNVQASLDSGNRIVAQADMQAFPDGRGGQTIVATIGIDDPPRVLRELGNELEALVVAADRNIASLTRVSTLVVERTTMRELANTAQGDAIEVWVRGGGQLIVEGPPGSLDGVFAGVATANPNRMLVGAGSVLFDEQWRDGVPIGGYGGSTAMARLLDDQGFGSGAAGELIVLAGVGLPKPSTITLVLLGYAGIAGPLLFAVATRRSMQRRIWLLLPAIAILVAVGVLLFGLLNGSGQSEAHITIVEVDDEGSQATTNLLIGSRFGSTREVSAPAGWSFLGQNRGANERAVQVRPGLDGVSVAMDLPPSGNGNLRLVGPASRYDGAVRIENIQPAGPNDVLASPGVVADFVNDSGVQLVDVVAFLGGERSEIGTVNAGEIVSFSIEFDNNDGRLMRELLIWPRVRRDWQRNGPIAVPNPNEGDTPVETGAWTQWRIEEGASAIPPHVLGVVGWTNELASPIGDIEQGNTALFVREPLPETAYGQAWAATTYLPANPDIEVPFFQNDFFGWTQQYRFTLGPDIDPEDLAFVVGPESAGISVLIENEWVNAELNGAGGRQNVVIALPDGAAESGEIIARALIPEWEWNAPQALFISASDATTETVPWSADNLSLRNTDGPFFDDDFNRVQVIAAIETSLEPDSVDVYEGDVFDFEAIEYIVELETGEVLTATLRSDTGDAYLEIYEGSNLMSSNDDFGGSLDSQVVFTSANGGQVQVRAQGLGGQPLSFRLELDRSSE